MIEARIRDSLEPLLRLYRRDSPLRVPMISGTIPGLVLGLPLLALAFVSLVSDDLEQAWWYLTTAILGFANWFIIGFVVAAVILRLLGRRFR